jgi:hypothetical protein
MELKLRRILANEAPLINALLADEDIREGALLGRTATDGIDILPFIADERNIALVCEEHVEAATYEDGKGHPAHDVVRGALLFHWQDPCIYEVHTMALRSARGKAYMRCVQEALRTMFLCWDTMELWTRVPEGNAGALGLVRFVKGKEMFRSQGATYYLLRFEDWLWHSAASLIARGKWFHERLETQFVEQQREHEAHEDSEDHDRMVGAASEMILSGMVEKGVVLYNRWAKMAGYTQISVVVPQPLVLNIGDALIQVDFARRDFLLLEIAPSELRAAQRKVA